MSPCCDLDFEGSNNKMSIRLWLMMLHYHTKFGIRWSAVQKISSGQTFTNNVNLHCDLDLECSNPIFHRTLWLMMLYYKTKFGCKLISSLEDTTETVTFELYKPFLWTWLWTQWTNFSAWYSCSGFCITTPSLLKKMFCGSNDMIQTDIHWHFEPSLWPWPWM